MSENKSICLRFNIKKPESQRTWEILQKSDKSYSKLIIEALIEYDERHSRLAVDPYFENREREDRFAEQIVEAVKASLENTLPTFFSAVLMNMIQPYVNQTAKVPDTPKKQEEISEDSVDWDFLGS